MHSYNDYSIDAYGSMIRDQHRMAAYTAALQRAISPGCVVLDIGAATGIFSFLACQFGAARVYAVEPDPSIEVARNCAKNIAGSDRITWIQDLSTKIELPEQVDVVVGDLHGVLPFFKGNITSLLDARKRHLKPGGKMIPFRDLLYAVPAHAPEEYVRLEAPWMQNEYGLDFSSALPYVTNTWWRASAQRVQAENLLGTPLLWGEVLYATNDIAKIENVLDWEMSAASVLHGFYVWFDGDLGNDIKYSNSPVLPALVYGRAFFPLERAVSVQPGDRVKSQLSVHLVKDDYIYRWKTRVTRPDGRVVADFDQSTFMASVKSLADIRKGSTEYNPNLTDDGKVTLAALQGMTGNAPVLEIARDLAARFPERFSNAEAALDVVARLSRAYG
ncbi:MAG: class I SAM-dependent methyltransferase [Burkholderiaceae bacterium]